MEYSTRKNTSRNRMRVYFAFSAFISAIFLSGCMTTDGVEMRANLSNTKPYALINIHIRKKVEDEESNAPK